MSAGPVAALAAGGSVAAIVLGVGRFLADRPAMSATRSPGGGPLARRAGGRRLGAQLERAGIPVGPDAFVAIVAALAACAGALGLAAARTPLAGLVGAVAVAAGAVSLVRSADRRHLARVERQLPGVAQQLAAAIHAGLSLRQALARSARDASEPIRAELERAVAELALGGRLEGVLEGLAARLPAHDLRIMVTAILVQRRTGGNLARALADLSGRMEERAQLERELRGSTAQARMTAWLVAALPVAGGAMAELAAPGTLVGILGSGPGPALLVASTTLYAVGLLWIRRIGRVEP
jgi:tight adherence protein B